MTCIVGVVDTKRDAVVMGADSAGVGNYDITIRKDPKIFYNDEFLIGCTSSFRMIQLLRFSFTPPPLGKKEVYEYMCTDFVNAVRDCFEDGGFKQKFKTGDEKGGVFLVGYKNRLFQIQEDFQVGEALIGIDACGCGAEYALGAMYVNDKATPQNRVKAALEAAETFSAGVAGPFIVLETK